MKRFFNMIKVLAIIGAVLIIISAVASAQTIYTKGGTAIENTDSNEIMLMSSYEEYYDQYIRDGVRYGVNSDGDICAIGYDLTIGKNLVIQNNVRYIADNAFYNCSILETVTIPEGVIYIGVNAFNGCVKMKTISIPSTVERINNSSFLNTKSLEGFTVDRANETYKSVDGVLIDMKEDILIQYPINKSATVYQVPDGVKIIGQEAFRGNKNLKEVSLASCTTTIDNNAFEYAESLEKINFANVEVIGDSAFDNCYVLQTINLPKTLIEFVNTAFRDCPSIKEINVENGNPHGYFSVDGVLYKENVDGYKTLVAYPSASPRTEFIIPGGIEAIGQEAFWRADNIKKLVFNDELKCIKSGGITACGNLKDVVFNDNLERIESHGFQTNTKLERVVLGKGVNTIENNAFSGCKALSYIYINEGVIRMGENIFRGCENIAEIEVSENNELFTSVGGVLCNKAKTKIVQYPTARKSSSYTIPATVTDIDSATFSNSKYLKNLYVEEGNQYFHSIDGVLFTSSCALHTYPAGRSDKEYTMPETTTSVENYAFYKSSVEKVNFGSNVKSIGQWAFAYSKLRECELPNTLERIEELSFFVMDELETITVPPNVNYVGNQAFDYCDNLDYITFLGTTPPETEWMLCDNSEKLRYVYVPYGMQIEYKDALAGILYPGAMIVEGTKVTLEETQNAIKSLPEQIKTQDYELVTEAKNSFVRLNNAEKAQITDEDIFKLEAAVEITNPDLSTSVSSTNEDDQQNENVDYNSISVAGINIASGIEVGQVELETVAQTPQEKEFSRFDVNLLVNGEAAQPKSPIIFKIGISEELKEKRLFIAHYNDNGTVKEYIAPTIKDDSLSFRMYSLSAFAIIELSEIEVIGGHLIFTPEEDYNNTMLAFASYDKDGILFDIAVLNKDFKKGSVEEIYIDPSESSKVLLLEPATLKPLK